MAKVSVKEHGEILEAIKAHDGDAAEAAMKEHIMRSRDDMLLIIIRGAADRRRLLKDK